MNNEGNTCKVVGMNLLDANRICKLKTMRKMQTCPFYNHKIVQMLKDLYWNMTFCNKRNTIIECSPDDCKDFPHDEEKILSFFE